MEMDDSGAGIRPLTTLFLLGFFVLSPTPPRPHSYSVTNPSLSYPRRHIFFPRPSLNLPNLCVFISVSCSSSPGEERNNGALASQRRPREGDDERR